MPTAYKYFPKRPRKLTGEFTASEYAKLTSRIEGAEKSKTANKWLELFADWNELKSYIDSEGSRLYYKFSQNMTDRTAEADEKYYREKIVPVATKPEHELLRAFVDSKKHRNQIVKTYGDQLTTVANMALKPLAPINIKLRVKSSNIEQAYEKLLGSGKVKVGGKEVTLTKCRIYLESPDEKLRKEAFLAHRQWFLKSRSKLADHFNKLVELRTQMARNLKMNNFIPLAYEQMGRSDYSERDVAEFRRLTKKYMTPLIRQMTKGQARALGKNKLKPWDGYDPRTTLPLGVVPLKIQLPTAKKVFKKLSSRLSGHYEEMLKAGAIDLENRPGKRPGAFSIGYSDTGEEFILANSTGNADDIRTLMHEVGHAFQGLESNHIKAVDLQRGTYELAEINSTSMEFLSLRHIDDFLKPKHAKRYIIERWEGAVSTLCTVAVGDEFQHWIYKNPKASTEAREEKWSKLIDYYLSPTDYTGYEKYKGLGWYGIHHFFVVPFYYIDYALAETAAMQIAMIDAHDHDKAMGIYMELCRLGGTKSFLAALKHVGLRSPFDESLIRDLANHTAKMMELNPEKSNPAA